MTVMGPIFRFIVAAGLAMLALATTARAELVLSELVIELQPGKENRKDIELWNNSDDRSYVEIAPAEIVNPGQANELRVPEPNPERLGLLVSPNRLILEPRQHKVVRIASISPPTDRERIYRVTVKPIVGEITGDQSGLKIVVGYDVLAIVRPSNPRPILTGERDGRNLIIRNSGNVNAELSNGKQCNPSGSECKALPGKRIYAGADWPIALQSDGPVEYSVISGGKTSTVRF